MATARPRTELADRLRRGDQLVGAMLRMPSEALVELAGHVGLDFVVIDTEHGPGDQMPLTHHLVAAAAVGIPALVRIGGPAEILRALDLGAAGIVAPHVSAVAEARALVAAAHYPPLGERGLATTTRAGRYGLVPAIKHLEASRRALLVFAMIEDPAGVAAARAIAELPGIDGLLVGPVDLASALGIPGRTQDASVQAAIRQVHADARRAGASVVSIAGDARAARAQLAAGSDVVIYNLQATVATLLAGLAAIRPGGAGSSGAVAAAREPLVLLPGMLGDDSTWAEVAALLGDQAAPRACRIDLDDSVPEMARSVLAAAPERFALAGHSLGGIVALEVLRQAPHRVTLLALCNTSGRPPSDEQLTAWARLRERVEAGEFLTAASEVAVTNLPEHRRGDAELVERCERMARSVGADGLLRQLAAQATRPDSLPFLADIAVPTLVLSGAVDQISPPALQQELAAGIDGAERVMVPGAGHMAPLEDPAAVAAHLAAWFQR